MQNSKKIITRSKETFEIFVKINKENYFRSCIKDKGNYKLDVKEKERYRND
jgi:hypothetical protein